MNWRTLARRGIVQAFHFLASVLEGIGNGTYRRGLLWYEMTATKSVDTLYQIGRLSGQLPTYVNRSSVKLQPFPLRHSFIPADLTALLLHVKYCVKIQSGHIKIGNFGTNTFI